MTEAAPRPRVGLVFVNWNGWQDTLDAIRAVQAGSFAPARIVCVDNGSTDGSLARLRAAAPEVELVASPANLGFSGGCNLGIEALADAGLDYVWLLNNDTVAGPTALEAMVLTAESDPGLGAVGAVLYYLDAPDTVQVWGGARVNLWTGRVVNHRHAVDPRELDMLSGASLLLRMAALEAVGGLDASYFMYFEDTELSFKLRAAGWGLAVADHAVVLHKESASLGRRSAATERLITDSGIQFLSRYAPVPPLAIALGFGARALGRVLRGDSRAALAITGRLLRWLAPWR